MIVVLAIGAGTKRFGRLWVFGWTYDSSMAEKDARIKQLETEKSEWQSMALDLLGTAQGVVQVAQQNTTMTPEQAVETLRVLGIQSAEDAKRIVREAGRDRGVGNAPAD